MVSNSFRAFSLTTGWTMGGILWLADFFGPAPAVGTGGAFDMLICVWLKISW
jgi:hypothetical protein